MNLYVDWDNRRIYTQEEYFKEANEFVDKYLDHFINYKFTAFELYEILPSEIQDKIREKCQADYVSESITNLDVITIKI